jgi:hypothetical protein
MRIRQAIIRICVVAGLVAAAGGMVYGWVVEDFFAGSIWAVFGIGLMASAGVYSLALDDPQARAKALGEEDHTDRDIDRDTELVDVRDSTVEPPVQAHAEYDERLSANR